MEAYAPVSSPTVSAFDSVQSYQVGSRRRFPCRGRPYYTDGDMSIILNEEKEAIKIGLNESTTQGKVRILSSCRDVEQVAH